MIPWQGFRPLDVAAYLEWDYSSGLCSKGTLRHIQFGLRSILYQRIKLDMSYDEKGEEETALLYQVMVSLSNAATLKKLSM